MRSHQPTIARCLRRTLAKLVAAMLTASAAQATPATLELDGLGGEAEIRIDRHGVAHLRAASEDDVFFVQGVNAARDRLFQIDLWRRRGLGELAAAFGPDFVAQDRAARLLLYRGAIAREWAAYGDAARARRSLQRFAAGVNAWIDWLEAHPEEMPWEFRELGYRPARWSAEDVVRIRTHALSGNLLSEVARARTLCLTGSLDADRWRSPLSDGWKPAAVAEVDPCLPADVLAEFQRATQGVTFARHPADGTVRVVHADADPSPAAEGSNNWVIAPARTTTGRALLANDPHRAYSVPSLRYLVHLTAPGLDVIGAGEPALPGIALGHNGRIAFGLTLFPTDQEDLVVYPLHAQDDQRYRVDGRWQRFRTLRERVAVRNGETVPIELRYAGDEPVIHVDSESRRAFVLRSVWALPGAQPYLASLAYIRAQDFPGFRAALARAGTPSLNYVYADDGGNIAWVVAGLVPLRRKGDGLLPVPGGQAYAWTRMLRGDELPWALNPDAGFIATANAYNLPPAYPVAERRIGFEWYSPARIRRIEEVLGASARMTLDDVLRLQTDVTSIPARRLLALLARLEGRDAVSRAALALLAGWDAGVRADSAPAALAEVWMTAHLPMAVARAVLDSRALAAVPELDPDLMLEALERPAEHLGGAAPRDRLLLDTLVAAYRDCERLLGADARAWRWGALHTSRLEHPLSGVVDAATRARIDVGPLPVGGSTFTVNQAVPDTDWRSVHGPSVRLVVDVGNWDASRAINHPGQSGNPDDPHYRDLAAPWSAGGYFPLLYSRAAVDAATERVIRLRPAPR